MKIAQWTCFILSAAATPALSAPPPVLDLPIACTPGKTCFIQQYFDHDPTPGAKDYRCGSQVYDGHDGVDIRLPTVAAQHRGVAVLAVAVGTVLGVRDGVEDHLAATPADRAATKGRECGNGVLIGHGDGGAGGWQTQYCHLARGSIAVTKGQVVKAGERLGLVGLSGDTQFPHVHISVREGVRKVDPFAPDAAPGTCAPTGGGTLWSAQARAALAYRASEVINIGFADAPVDMAALEAGSLRAPTRQSDAVIGYGRAIGLRAGDRMVVTLTGPDGVRISDNGVMVDRPKAQYMLFTGRPRPPAGWAPGRYSVSVMVMHGAVTAASATGTMTMP